MKCIVVTVDVTNTYMHTNTSHIVIMLFAIVGKFGGENLWQIYSFQVFGRKSLANEYSKSAKGSFINLDGFS